MMGWSAPHFEAYLRTMEVGLHAMEYPSVRLCSHGSGDLAIDFAQLMHYVSIG